MSEQRVMVVRTSDEPKDHSFLWEEIQNGRLRQGWGIGGLQLIENDRVVPPEVWEKRFNENVQKHWQETPEPGDALKRYRILLRLLDLKAGDLVVVPKN